MLQRARLAPPASPCDLGGAYELRCTVMMTLHKRISKHCAKLTQHHGAPASLLHHEILAQQDRLPCSSTRCDRHKLATCIAAYRHSGHDDLAANNTEIHSCKRHCCWVRMCTPGNAATPSAVPQWCSCNVQRTAWQQRACNATF